MPSADHHSFTSTITSIKEGTTDFCSELLRDSLHSAAINPYNSAVQLTKSAAKEFLHTDLKITTTDALKPTENATGARAAGKSVGEMAGTVFDYMLTMKVLSKVPGLKSANSTNATAITEAEQLLTARKVTMAGTAGFAQGALMTPLQDGDSNWTRVAHGGATSLSFMAMEAAPYAPGLNRMEKGFKSGLIKSAVAGGAAGAVQTQADSLLTTGRPADAMQTIYSTIGGAAGGAAFHGVTKIGGHVLERTNLTAVKETRPLKTSGLEIITTPETSGKVTPETSAKVATPTNRLLDGHLEINEDPEKDRGLVKSMQTAEVHHTDGTKTKVVIRSLDTEDDTWALQRVQHAQIVRNLHIQEGYAGKPPEIGVRTETVDGVTQPISVQEYGGQSFGGVVRDWTATSMGLDPATMTLEDFRLKVSSQDIANYIGQHPSLQAATAEGVARKLVDGGLDLNLSNWTISETADGSVANPDGPLHLYDIDPKRGFASNTTPTYGPEIKFGDSPQVVKALGGQKLSVFSGDLQIKFDTLVAGYEGPNGLAKMEAAGLTRPEAEARLARMQSLAKDGFPPFLAMGFPPENPVIYMTPEYDAQAEILDKEILAKAKSMKLQDVAPTTNR